MNVLVVLAMILFGLMVLVGGKKGVKSFISLFINFGVILVMVFFMMDPNTNPIVLTLMACIVIVCVNLFYVNEVNSKTKMAFISTIVTLIVLFLFIHYITKSAMIQGFGEEEIVELAPFSLLIGIDFVKISVSIVIISTVGAITDVAIAISSPMRELKVHNPHMSRKDLFTSGMRIGRDILGTDTNTLFFAFIGGYLALILLFKDLSYSIGEIVNSKIFVAEIVTILCASIGIAIIIPITSWINATYLTSKSYKS
ncbi:YibE/F family protein [Sporosarcina ureilytica]|uniref:YibE/F n=1 Tax=Sporosarcina ureilytica TaxID=298596 RepID=A0A1D8JFS4_9BACL|nr:YibE/F family protein [Sporosarcina ureilytica]AOV07564.1 YibE/F [Sporosarcina ureilytica]